MDDESLKEFESSSGFEIGVGPSIVVVDAGVGKTLTTTTVQKGIYAFIFDQKGLMAGLASRAPRSRRSPSRRTIMRTRYGAAILSLLLAALLATPAVAGGAAEDATLDILADHDPGQSKGAGRGEPGARGTPRRRSSGRSTNAIRRTSRS
jgi:hypothetical protein